MKLSEPKVYVDAWKYEAVMLFDKPDDTRHYAEMLVEAHEVIVLLKDVNAALKRENEGLRKTIKITADELEGHVDEENPEASLGGCLEGLRNALFTAEESK